MDTGQVKIVKNFNIKLYLFSSKTKTYSKEDFFQMIIILCIAGLKWKGSKVSPEYTIQTASCSTKPN